ncbi:hypothetical protein EIP86_006663 [Pleurotus ostreatoroseus]|nr:hypothetical protein EIP86_006663 [Pleurotus ostreatoroseus]
MSTNLDAKVTQTKPRYQAETDVSTKSSSSQTNKLESRAVNKNKTTGRPAKGASLANPSKKARKYQPLEFEDD